VLRGTIHKGRAAVHDFVKEAFAGRLKGTRGVDDPQDIRIVGGDTAIIVSRAGVLMPGETEVPADRAVLATWILAKVDGEWLVTAYSNTPA
jgi:uncharacterized protein (TIGR02246 family)